jgi:hypothetical protein
VSFALNLLPIPGIVLAAPVLQIFVNRAWQMWRSWDYEPARGFTATGRTVVLDWDRRGLTVDVAGQLRQLGQREVRGVVVPGPGPRGRHLVEGDPVALAVSNQEWRATGAGLVIPARVGEPFRLQLPLTTRALTAYAVDWAGRPKTDPVRAIGAWDAWRLGTVGGSPTPTRRLTVTPRPRGTTPTRLARDSGSVPWREVTCRHCGQVNRTLFVFRSRPCIACGKPLGALRSKGGEPRFDGCSNCGRLGLVGLPCWNCGSLQRR